MDENWSLNSACGRWTGVDAGCSVCSMSRLRSDRCLGSGTWCLRRQWLAGTCCYRKCLSVRGTRRLIGRGWL